MALLSACGPQSTEPDGERIIFEPAERNPLVLNSGQLQFSAKTDDGRPAQAKFFLDDVLVREDVQYIYRAPVSGDHDVRIRAEVDVPRFFASAEWVVRVRRIAFWPTMESFQLWPSELIRLRAEGAGDRPLVATYSVNGSEPVAATEFDFRQSDEGLYQVEAIVELNGSQIDHTWNIIVSEPHPDPPELEVVLLPLQRVTPTVSLFGGIVPPVEYEVNGATWQGAQPPSFVADEPIEVRIVAQVGGYLLRQATVYWRILTREPTPGVRTIDVRGGPQPGSLLLRWDRPVAAPDQEPVASYRIGWAEHSFPTGEFDGVDHLDVVDRPEETTQEVLLTGLEPGGLYYVRVQSRGASGRGSFPSYDIRPVMASRPISLEGRIQGLGFAGPLHDLSGLSVVVDVFSTTTGPDGSFVLPVLAGNEALSFSVFDPSGEWAGLRADLPAEDHSMPVLVFPRSTVPIVSSDSSEPASMTMSEYVRWMTSNDRPPYTVARWETWPVRVALPEYAYESEIETVDYRLAFERAIETWNLALGEPVVVAPGPGEIHQVEARIDIEPGGEQLLGQVIVVEPAGGALFEVIPRRVAMRLRTNFRTQRFADQVVLHEMGHALGLAHSVSEADVMHDVVNERNPSAPSTWESYVLRWLKRAPLGFDMSWYQDDISAGARPAQSRQ